MSDISIALESLTGDLMLPIFLDLKPWALHHEDTSLKG